MLIRTPAIPSPAKPPEPDRLRGVMHVHTEHSHDSALSLKQLIDTARKAELDFVVVSDHNTRQGAEEYAQADYPARPLLIFGEEVATTEGHLTVIGAPEVPKASSRAQTVIRWVHDQGGYVFLAHPLSSVTPWRDWGIRDYDGFEIYNFGHTISERNRFKIFLKGSLLPPKAFLKSFHRTPEKGLERWNEISRNVLKVAVPGSDAHIHWRWLGFAPEPLLIYLQSVTLYVWTEQFEASAIVRAIGKGKSYMAFESLGDASRFQMRIQSAQGRYWPGERIPAGVRPVLFLDLPRRADIRLIRSGERIDELTRQRVSYPLEQAGIYRVEVYQGDRLWIVANPFEITS